MEISLYLFIISFIILGYIYLGYPFILLILSKLKRSKHCRKELSLSVSIVMVAYNEEINLKRKLDNLLSLEYEGAVKIFIGSDGSIDLTNKILKEYEEKFSNIVIKISDKRVGKINIINQLIEDINDSEIIFFCDVRQVLKKDVLKEIIANFHDKEVGAVSGELVFYQDDDTLTAEGVGLYWRYEKAIRRMESKLFSMIGATGAIYAIRRELFVPPTSIIILDDIFIPMKIVEQGYRVLFDNKAIAYDKVATSIKHEFLRKVRTLAGNFQLFFKHPEFLNPFKNKIAIQFFSHKFLRAFAFIFIITLFFSNMFLKGDYFIIFFYIQILFYLLAMLGYFFEKRGKKSKILSFPYVFCSLNIASMLGLIKVVFSKQSVVWKKTT